MSVLVRIREWLAGDTLTASALNTEFDNLIDGHNAQETSITALEGSVTTLESDVAAAEAAITALEDARHYYLWGVVGNTSNVTTGDGKAYIVIPEELHGFNLVEAKAHVFTASSSGLPTIQIARIRGGATVDMLSTRITVDANEKDSATAAAPAVVDTTNDDVEEGDELRADVDVAGTGTQGLHLRLSFQAP